MKERSYKAFPLFISRLLPVIFTGILLTTLPACAQRTIAASSVVSGISADDVASLQSDILKLVNQHRSRLGLGALQLNEAANTEATDHSMDMAKGKMAFGHDGFDDRMKHIKEKLGFLRASAENVAYGKVDAEQVMNMWLNSPGHKKNIEGNYSLIGIGIAQSKDGYLYFTQIFLLK